MAITSVTISQDNIYSGSNLLPIHSPLIFIVDVIWTTTAPDVLKVDVLDENSTVLATYKCIPYSDISSDIRQFVFIANEPLRALMESFDDYPQLDETLIYIPELAKEFTLDFYDPDTPATNDTVTIMVAHGASQFGEYPNLLDQFNNTTDTYFAQEGTICYVYFYNADANNVLSIDTGVLQEGFAIDYDGTYFLDNGNENFTINELTV